MPYSMRQYAVWAQPTAKHGGIGNLGDIPANRHSLRKLIELTQTSRIHLAPVQNLIREDVSLSYKLIRLLNSSYFGMSRRVDSVRKAVSFYGVDRLNNWAAVLLANAQDLSDDEWSRKALRRARACEAAAREFGETAMEAYYLAGLFSTLPELTGASLELILPPLRLDEAIHDALMEGAGRMGKVLQSVIAHENFGSDYARAYWARPPVLF